MFAQFVAGGGWRGLLGLLRVLCRAAFEIVLEDVFGGPRLAGDFGEVQEKRFSKPPAMDAKNANGLVLGGALENYGVEIRNRTCQLWALQPSRSKMPAKSAEIDAFP